jgi:hypothetical protein
MSYSPGRPVTGSLPSSRARAFLTIPVGLVLLVATGCSGDTSATADTAPATVAASSATPSPTPTAAEPTSIEGEELLGVTEGDTATAVDGKAPRKALGDDVEALAALEALEVKGRAPKTGYDREQFGEAWADVDDNGCDTRNDILYRDLDDAVTSDGCTVTRGTLDPDPYTDTTIDFVRGPATSADVQIDHVVALSDAWQKGAQRLDAQTRVAFANDPLNLLAVDGPTNQAKGDKDAASWLPPNKGFRCEYVAIQIAVKAKYELWVTAAEKDAMTRVLNTCEGQLLPADAGVIAGAGAALDVDVEKETKPAPAQKTQEAAKPAPAPVTEAPALGGGGAFQNCSEAAAAGVYNIPAGSPAYSPDLDRNGDGVACESNNVGAVPATPEVPAAPAAPAVPEIPAPVAEPAPAAPAPAANYANCSAARAAGAAPVYAGQPGYGSHLDRDGDGVACE